MAFGMGALVQQSATVFTVVKLLGAGYLVYLGIQAVRHRRSLAHALHTGTTPAAASTARMLRDGVVVGFANPKTIVFLAALLPQFVNPDTGAVVVQMLLLGLAIPGWGLVLDSSWALLAGAARAWLATSPRRLELVGGSGGLVMIGLGVSLAATGRRD